MRVLGAGLPRTGTSSFKLALEDLGCGPCYHNVTLWEKPEHVGLWKAVEDGEPADWHAIFAGYNSALDWPASIFYEQQMAAFPEAKVILTVRDAGRWYDSMSNTILWAIRQDSGPGMEDYMQLMKRFWERIFEGGIFDRERAIATYNRLNSETQEKVPADRLLVYEVSQGWEPLCRFLDLPVPEGKDFPHINDTEAFRQRLIDMQSAAQHAGR